MICIYDMQYYDVCWSLRNGDLQNQHYFSMLSREVKRRTQFEWWQWLKTKQHNDNDSI